MLDVESGSSSVLLLCLWLWRPAGTYLSMAMHFWALKEIPISSLHWRGRAGNADLGCCFGFGLAGTQEIWIWYEEEPQMHTQKGGQQTSREERLEDGYGNDNIENDRALWLGLPL